MVVEEKILQGFAKPVVAPHSIHHSAHKNIVWIQGFVARIWGRD
jgi:hypothetical protein